MFSTFPPSTTEASVVVSQRECAFVDDPGILRPANFRHANNVGAFRHNDTAACFMSVSSPKEQSAEENVWISEKYSKGGMEKITKREASQRCTFHV
jgi:hypothetical protein